MPLGAVQFLPAEQFANILQLSQNGWTTEGRERRLQTSAPLRVEDIQPRLDEVMLTSRAALIPEAIAPCIHPRQASP